MVGSLLLLPWLLLWLRCCFCCDCAHVGGGVDDLLCVMGVIVIISVLGKSATFWSVLNALY